MVKKPPIIIQAGKYVYISVFTAYPNITIETIIEIKTIDTIVPNATVDFSK
jgi:hypothetical protein